MLIAAADASGLENRVAGHFTMKWDGGEYARLILDGDCHSFNCKYVFFEEEVKTFDITSPSFDKDDPRFKPYRGKSKNGLYALLYGASPSKLATTIGKPEKDGQRIYDRFWEVNKGVGLFKDALTKFWETKGQKKWIPGIDGRRIYTRSKHSLVNSCWQSAGGITVDYALCFMDKWLGGIKFDEKGRPYYLYKGKVVKRVLYQHDEAEFEADEDVADEISQMVVKAIKAAGKYLKFRVPLEGEGKVGQNWMQTH